MSGRKKTRSDEPQFPVRSFTGLGGAAHIDLIDAALAFAFAFAIMENCER